MKRLSLFIAMIMISMATIVATTKNESDPADFLKRYQSLIESIEAIDPDKVDEEKLDSLKATYKELTKELKIHKSAMDNDQLEKYYGLKARYQKKIAVIKTRRSAKAMKGWVEGMF